MATSSIFQNVEGFEGNRPYRLPRGRANLTSPKAFFFRARACVWKSIMGETFETFEPNSKSGTRKLRFGDASKNSAHLGQLGHRPDAVG
jgi:hypothetical protein